MTHLSTAIALATGYAIGATFLDTTLGNWASASWFSAAALFTHWLSHRKEPV